MISPRARAVMLLVLIVSAALLTTWRVLLVASGVGLIALVATGLSSGAILRRLAWIAYLSLGLVLTLPWVVPGAPLLQLRLGWAHLSASRTGLELAGLTCLRMMACSMGALALTASVPVPKTLEGLGVPRFFVLLVGMAIRYIAVLREEAERQLVSRRSRCYRPARAIWRTQTLRTSAQTLGMLLLRAHDRSERIYLAMMSRGYGLHQSAPQPEPFSGSDRWIIAISVVLALGLVFVDHRIKGG